MKSNLLGVNVVQSVKSVNISIKIDQERIDFSIQIKQTKVIALFIIFESFKLIPFQFLSIAL